MASMWALSAWLSFAFYLFLNEFVAALVLLHMASNSRYSLTLEASLVDRLLTWKSEFFDGLLLKASLPVVDLCSCQFLKSSISCNWRGRRNIVNLLSQQEELYVPVRQKRITNGLVISRNVRAL